jgi:hypothetical protein
MFSFDNKATEQLTVVRCLGNMIYWKSGVICPVPVEGGPMGSKQAFFTNWEGV